MSCPYVSSPRLFLGCIARSGVGQPATASERDSTCRVAAR